MSDPFAPSPRPGVEEPAAERHSGPADGDPFAGDPLRPGDAAGCGKPVLVGCGVLALLLLVALVVLVVRAESLLAWSLGQYRDVVVAGLPEDVTPQERQRLETAFEAVLMALESGELDRRELPQLQSVLLRTSSKVERLRRRDVLELTEALERAAGIQPAAPHPAPEPPAEEEPAPLTTEVRPANGELRAAA